MTTKSAKPTDIYVGSRIRQRRNEINVSQTELGLALGITFQQVQKYEKGTNRVGASRLQEIAKNLGVPVGYFFEGQEESAALPDVVLTFASSSDGVRLNKAMARIGDHGHRMQIIKFAETLGERAA